MPKQPKKNQMKKLIAYIFTLVSLAAFTQEQPKDTLNTDEIIVVKPYTPKISDAFKIKNNPQIENENVEKDSVTYTFESVEVASTFTPAKGKAQSVVREPLDKIYNSYVALGLGNYKTPYLEAFLNSSSSRYNDFGAIVKHHSSQGGIDGVLVDDSFYDSYLKFYYKQFERDYSWEASAGVDHQIKNWYGLPNEIAYDPNFLSTIDPNQVYLNIFGDGKFTFEEGVFKGGYLEIDYFSDDYNSSEIQALIVPEIEFPISSELISMPSVIEYITGSFDQNYITDESIDYSFVNLGISPSLEILRDDLTVNLGARVYYSSDLEQKANDFYFYPNVTASYKLIDESLIAYTGVVGDLEQQSYREFAQDNPFVSPTLNIQRTDNQYNAFLGAKGKLSSNVGYNFKASYGQVQDKALYVNNFSKTDGTTLPTYNYEAGNSFGIVYDQLETISAFAEIDVYISKEFTFGGTITYNNYTTKIQSKAWNLPTLTATAFAKYNAKKWYINSDIYFANERYDLILPFGELTPTEIELDPYVDLNFNGGYVFTDRLTAFGRVNNVLGINYEKYVNYKVQGIQVLAGIIYKFDF